MEAYTLEYCAHYNKTAIRVEGETIIWYCSDCDTEWPERF